jgi:Ca2+/H+ antiporter
MPPFNTAAIKRQAHSLSRTSSEQSWNPFRHVAWDKRGEKRAETWDGGRLESQTQHRPATASSLPTSRTAPAAPEDPLTTEAMAEQRRDFDGSAKSIDNEPDNRLAHIPSAENETVLRNRKPNEMQASAAQEQSNGYDNGDQSLKMSKTKTAESKKNNRFFRNVQPKTPFTIANQLQRTLLNSWINILLIAAPVGIAIANVHSIDRIAVFVVNFVAIVPLAAMLSFATEEIALRTGETLGGLLNATFGNAVELIIAIIALADDKIQIVQTSLVGSILSNLLLVLGFCFFFGGLRRQEQFFNTVVAQTAASLLALAVASVIVPTVFDYASDAPQGDVAKLSRGTSVILLLVYGAYLFFQLKTHHGVFSEESQKVPAKPWSSRPASLGDSAVRQGLVMPGALMGYAMPAQSENDRLSKMLMNPTRPSVDGGEDEDDEGEEPQLSFAVAVVTLAVSTAIIALCAEYMVDSIDAITESGGLSEEFVGLILLPIVGNAAEHATAVTVAIKDKMDLAIGVAVGSSMQVALFLIPLVVVIGWGMGNDLMDLSFDIFQVTVLFVAVLLVNYLIADGKSHWLEGFLLICLYAIIAVCAFWYPQALD